MYTAPRMKVQMAIILSLINFDAINLQLRASKAAFEYQLVRCTLVCTLHLEMQETDFICHGFGDENHDKTALNPGDLCFVLGIILYNGLIIQTIR